MARINDAGGLQGLPPVREEAGEQAPAALVTRNELIGVAPA